MTSSQQNGWDSSESYFSTDHSRISPKRVASFAQKRESLNNIYQLMTKTITEFQSPTTGLFPAEVGGNNDNNEIADIRTSIYSALSIWSMQLAFGKTISDDAGRAHLMGQTAVKTMRGILCCWMNQIDKLKAFTSEQIPRNATHVRFDMMTGEALPGDDYHHLQMDCISLYLLSLVQMISSGLQIIYTCDEVDFVQNLVFCIERAYRIADFGMWERGSKYNNGTPELNASSVGMAKAALEAVNGFNLFGEHGASWTVIYVDVDAHMRNRRIFENLMPRESSSKSCDASLLPVLTWPCFAIHDSKVKNMSIGEIFRTLKGKYGIKRYLRDGYGTVLEDPNRRYYDPCEIKLFDGLECEWPFLTFFIIIDCMFRGDQESADKYLAEIEPYLRTTKNGVTTVPKYYYVPTAYIQAERDNPGGDHKVPSDGESESIFLWGQSVYIIMKLLVENLLPVNELDSIKRHLTASQRPKFSHRYTSFEATIPDRVIQVAIIAESMRLHQALATYGIPSQTPTQVEPIQIWSPNELKRCLQTLGVNEKLALPGRPNRPVGLLGTSMFYRICGKTVLSYPLLFELNDFYISQDINSVINQVEHDIEILSQTWKISGKPTYLIMVTEAMVHSPDVKDLIDLLASFKTGVTLAGSHVKLDRLQSLVASSAVEHLDFIHGLHHQRENPHDGHDDHNFNKVVEKMDDQFSQLRICLETRSSHVKNSPIDNLETYPDWRLHDLFNSTEDVHIRSQVLKHLLERYGKLHQLGDLTIADHLEAVRKNASHGATPNWSAVRLCSALAGKLVDSLAPSITNILVRGKQITLGVFGHEEQVVDKPLNPRTLGEVIYRLCLPVEPREAVLQQEMILILGQLHGTQPHLFDGILQIRVGWILHAMQYTLSYDSPGLDLFSISPSEIQSLLIKILNNAGETDDNKRGPLWRRRLHGCLGRVPKNFYSKIWYILQRTPGGIQINSMHLPQQPTLSDLTVHEMKFPLLAEDMLGEVRDPLDRQMCVEILMVVAVVLERNPELKCTQTVNLKDLMDLVMKQFSHFVVDTPDGEACDIRDMFYKTPTDETYSYVAKAVCSTLLKNSVQVGENRDDCLIM